jgi:hypothetical protein
VGLMTLTQTQVQSPPLAPTPTLPTPTLTLTRGDTRHRRALPLTVDRRQRLPPPLRRAQVTSSPPQTRTRTPPLGPTPGADPNPYPNPNINPNPAPNPNPNPRAPNNPNPNPDPQQLPRGQRWHRRRAVRPRLVRSARRDGCRPDGRQHGWRRMARAKCPPPPPWAVPEADPRPLRLLRAARDSSGRGETSRHHSTRAPGAQLLPRVLERAASKVAHWR